MNLLHRIGIALLAGLACGMPQVAAAQTPSSVSTDLPGSLCQVVVVPSPPSWIISGYDPFSDDLAEGTFNVTFTNQGTADCVFSPNFELAQPPFGLSKGTGQRIRYSILNLTEAQDVTPRALRSQRRSGMREITLRPRETRSLLYRVVVDPNEITSAGTFTQDLVIEAQDSSFRSFGGSPIVVGINVLPAARIGLAGAYSINDGQAMVDLGELRTGPAPVPLNLRVKSTGQYDISVRSANSGLLRLGNSSWSIPYEMVVGGKSLKLKGLESVAGNSGNGIRVDNLPMQFIIGDTSNRRAGRYSDTISISISAR